MEFPYAFACIPNGLRAKIRLALVQDLNTERPQGINYCFITVECILVIIYDGLDDIFHFLTLEPLKQCSQLLAPPLRKYWFPLLLYNNGPDNDKLQRS